VERAREALAAARGQMATNTSDASSE